MTCVLLIPGKLKVEEFPQRNIEIPSHKKKLNGATENSKCPQRGIYFLLTKALSQGADLAKLNMAFGVVQVCVLAVPREIWRQHPTQKWNESQLSLCSFTSL